MIEYFDYDFTHNVLTDKTNLEVITNIAEKIDRYHMNSSNVLKHLDEILNSTSINENIFDKLIESNIDIDITTKYNKAFIKQIDIHDNIGYIAINELYSCNLFESAINLIQHTDGLILDLSSTQGSDINACMEILDILLENETEVNIITKNHLFERVSKTIDNKTKFNKPIVIILNNESSSAANYIAIMLQKNTNTKVLGESTNDTDLKLEFILEYNNIDYCVKIPNITINKANIDIICNNKQIYKAYKILTNK